MVEIIVTGHGNFPTGLLSALELVAGKRDNVAAVDFLPEDSNETLSQKLRKQLEKSSSEVLILADLLGGSPYNESVLLKMSMTDKNIEVIAGSNFPMLLTGALESQTALSAGTLAEELLSTAKESVSRFVKTKTKIIPQDDPEEGI